jgi:hypothetical protein
MPSTIIAFVSAIGHLLLRSVKDLNIFARNCYLKKIGLVKKYLKFKQIFINARRKVCHTQLFNGDTVFVRFESFGPNARNLKEVFGEFKGTVGFTKLNNSIITAAFFSPTPFSCINSSAAAVLMLIFGESSAHAAENQAKTKTTTIANEIRVCNLRILYLR